MRDLTSRWDLITVLTAKRMYPARCFLNKNGNLLSGSKQLTPVCIQLFLWGKPYDQIAASICGYGSVQNFLVWMLRASAAYEWLLLHCLIFFPVLWDYYKSLLLLER